jgi:hypothetical protein
MMNDDSFISCFRCLPFTMAICTSAFIDSSTLITIEVATAVAVAVAVAVKEQGTRNKEQGTPLA